MNLKYKIIRDSVVKWILKEGPKSTYEIYEYGKKNWSRYPRMEQWIGLTTRDPRFIRVGTSRIDSIAGQGYLVAIWGVKLPKALFT